MITQGDGETKVEIDGERKGNGAEERGVSKVTRLERDEEEKNVRKGNAGFLPKSLLEQKLISCSFLSYKELYVHFILMISQ